MKDGVDAVWDDAFDGYFSLVTAKLSKSFPHNVSNEDTQLEADLFLHRLRIHFLFPDLTDLEREQLVVTSLTRTALQGYVTALGVTKDKMPDAVGADFEKMAMLMEDQLMGCKRVMKVFRLPEKMTSFQLEMVERKLFHIHFPEKSTL